uniref:Uncharacterized protein n=1 Tax=Cyprinus carpio TaxID=7962 RepID=A0A8C1GIU1_CYPCA
MLFLAQEREKEKNREKDREAKEREKKSVNGHVFSTSSSLHPALCQQCNKTLNTKDTVNCTSKKHFIIEGFTESCAGCIYHKMYFC